jgi:Glycosyl-transferase for dystroglycan
VCKHAWLGWFSALLKPELQHKAGTSCVQVPPGLFVFLNDIDFIPTPSVYSELTTGKWRSELQHMREAFYELGKRKTLVLPAFERSSRGAHATPYPGDCELEDGCRVVQGMAMPRTFERLRTMLQMETVVDVFHRPQVRARLAHRVAVVAQCALPALEVQLLAGSCMDTQARLQFFAGHGCYSWLTWLQSDAPENIVPMDYAHPCEPYVIALSDALPRYDERFRGRGQNKVEQLAHMAMWGFEWQLLPGHFVLHVPHPSTGKPEGGWDIPTTPLALLKSKMEEIEREPEFQRHVVQSIPIPVKD